MGQTRASAAHGIEKYLVLFQRKILYTADGYQTLMENSVKTTHSIVYDNCEKLTTIANDSVDLVVTSPPYPMIEMWDDGFVNLNPRIGRALERNDVSLAFELMHQELDKVWTELYRVVKNGGIVCINIGDATRTFDSTFQLFSSHSRIISKLIGLGFQNLPNIIWRKTTNAPNKFMGSGMLPPGAYVTLEHEYILVFRKGNRRPFKTEAEKALRRESAYFWEERNQWFSDVWFDLRGISQELGDKELRKRSAAFPFELAYRLINMFSIKQDLVIDPFLGTGTTTHAAMTSERNSIGYEISESFSSHIDNKTLQLPLFAYNCIVGRLDKHSNFVTERLADGKDFKSEVIHHDVPCISKQESSMIIRTIDKIEKHGSHSYSVSYKDCDKNVRTLNAMTIKKNAPKRTESEDQQTLHLT